MKIVQLGVVLLCSFCVSAQNVKVVTEAAFQEMLDTFGLQFRMPEGFVPTKVKENPDLYYQFAIQPKKGDFEVRYSIWSLQPAITAFEECQLDTNCMMIDPNILFYGRAQSNVLNMTGGEGAGITNFNPQAVKNEFNADLGGTSFFQFDCEFGYGFKYGQMVVLHKDDMTDIIITYLSNSKILHEKFMNMAFHALRFK